MQSDNTAGQRPAATVVPLEAGRAYAFLVLAFAAFAAGSAIYEINLPNFLREQFTVGEWYRGFLEFPRESQGFAVVFYVVALGMLTERRLFWLAGAATAAGMIGLALIPSVSLQDGVAGIVPGLPLIAFMMLHSAGMHLGAMMERAIVVDHGDIASAGRRLGRIGFWKTLAALGAAAVVWGLRASTELGFSFFLGLGAALTVGSVLMTWQAMRGRKEVRPQRRRFVIKRKFVRYYLLSAMFGVRKQVFITFALWVLVVIYDQPAQTIALLWFITSVTNLLAQPWIGRLIDRYGPRRVLTVDALLLFVVCILYGYGAQRFEPSVGLMIVGATYVLDHILFFVGAARAVYVGQLADSRDELSTTLSLGVTIDHVFSMTVPFFGGIVWKLFGYEMVFLGAGVVALVTAVTAFGIRQPRPDRSSTPQPRQRAA